MGNDKRKHIKLYKKEKEMPKRIKNRKERYTSIEELNKLLIAKYSKEEIAKKLKISQVDVYILSKLLKAHNYCIDGLYKEYNPSKVLSPREKIIYKELVINGIFSQEEIAERVGVTKGTVTQQIHSIMVKLNCSCCSELIFKHYKRIEELRKKLNLA